MLRILHLAIVALLIPSLCFGAVSNLKEEDGSPDIYPWQLRVQNGSLTDNGDGTASLNIPAPDLSSYLTSATAASTYAPITEPLSLHLNGSNANTDIDIGTYDFTTTGTMKAGGGQITADNAKLLFGAAQDASIYYDGTNLNINPREVGTGATVFTGNVGIGTTSPGYALDVQYTSLPGANGIRAKGLQSSGSGEVRVTNSLNYDGVLFKTGPTYTGYKTILANDLGFFNDRAGNISILNNVGDIRFTSNGATIPHMIVATTGNVGIGTKAPQKLLDVYASSGATVKIHSSGAGPTTAGAVELLEHDSEVFTANYGEAHAYGTKLYYDGSANTFNIGMGNGTSTLNALTVDRNTGYIHLPIDSQKLYFGAGDDASIYYDGTNLNINPKEVGSGYLSVLGDIDAGANTIRTTGDVKGIHKTADGTAAVADGTYTVGIGTSTNGTITIKDGIITAIQEAT